MTIALLFQRRSELIPARGFGEEAIDNTGGDVIQKADGTATGKEHASRAGADALDLGEQPNTIFPGHFIIGEHCIECSLLKDSCCLCGSVCYMDLPLILEQPARHPEDLRIVIHQQ